MVGVDGFEPTHLYRNGFTVRRDSPTSPHSQNLVFLQGNDPWSLAYQASALPLSYRNKLSKSNKKPSEDFPRRVLKLYTYSHKILVSGTLPSHIFLKFANKVSHFSPLFCFNLDELFACFDYK